MKLISVTGNLLGPFTSVITNADHYICDGILMYFSVLGTHQVVTTTIPDDFVASDYIWDGVLLSKKPADPAKLIPLKAAKNAEINAARLAANNSTFTHAGHLIACDELSRIDINTANAEILNADAMPQGWPGAWKAVDNTYLPIVSVSDWKAFYSSMFNTGMANFAKSQALKSALSAATTVDQINAIVWG